MKLRLLLACLALPLMAAEPALPGRPLLSPLFGSHMVLQRDQPNPIWGWADPGAEIELTLADHHTTATTDATGRWQAVIKPPPMGGPYTLTLDGPRHLELTDVLVGDVWLCSGQSNMEFDLARAQDGAEAVQASANDQIRLFRVASHSAYAPAATPSGSWMECGPAAFAQPGGFSAVAAYFGRRVRAETGVPIGLIQAAVGGTPAESWMSPAALASFPEFAPGLREIARLHERGAPIYGNYIMHWYDEYDLGLPGAWSAPDFDDSAWTLATLHDVFARLGVPATPAVVWLRRQIDLPDPLPAGPAQLLLGEVEKMDTAWINGQWIGASAWVENPRAYTVPARTLHPGKNQLTLRVLKTRPDGGFRSPAKSLQLVLADGTALPLEDDWRAALAVDARPPHPLPLGYENWPTMPAVLNFGMLQPLAPLAITGALWYQGEANAADATRAAQYRRLLPAMIADWRQLFGQPDLPFYIVSLPSFMARRDQPGTDGWTELRAAQAYTARTVPHTGLAITVDTGDADNIHPTDKAPVGDRLARLALHDVYGRDVVSVGPTFDHADLLPNGAVRIHFSHPEGGLEVRGERLGEFALAGSDGVWHWAEARLDGTTVVLSCPAVPTPVAASYAWQANPLATLFNGAGLPAAPFRIELPRPDSP